MSPSFKRFRDKISLLREKYKVPGRHFFCTGLAVFVAGCVLGSICLVYGESWTFALLYFFLGTIGSIICCLYEIRMPSKQKSEMLPLVSSDVKLLSSKSLLQKIFIEQRNDFRNDAKEKYPILPNNYNFPAVNPYFCSDYPLTSGNIEHGIDVNNKGAITCVELDSSRHIGVCHEQYVTGPPSPHGSSNQKTKEGNSKKTNVRSALNLVRKAFRLSSSDMETANPQNAPEAGTSKQVEQPAPEESPAAADPTSQQDNPSSIKGSLDATSPYQNVPSHEQKRTERIDPVPSKGTKNFERVPLPRETYSEYLHRTRGLQTPYPDYENVTQIRPGHYTPIQGPYFNIPETWHHKRKSVLVPATTARNLDAPQKGQYTDKGESTGQFVYQREGEVQKPRVCENTAQARPAHRAPVRSEGPYFNVPETWQHKQKISDTSEAARRNQQHQDRRSTVKYVDKSTSTDQGHQRKDEIQKTRPVYENVTLTLGHKAPVRSEGPYFNVPESWYHRRQSSQVPSATPDSTQATESETEPPQIAPRKSSKPALSDKRTVSTRQTTRETEDGNVQKTRPVAQIRAGFHTPVRPEGPYFNVSSTWQHNKQSVQDSGSTTNSACHSESENNQYSAGEYPNRNSYSEQASPKAEKVKRYRSMESFGNLTLSPWSNAPQPQKQIRQFQRYPDAAENLEHWSTSETKRGSRSVETLEHDKSGTKAKFSTPRGASNIHPRKKKPLSSERPHSCAFTSLENIKRTTMYATGTNVEHRTTTGQKKNVERIFPRNPRDCQIPPAQEPHKSQYPISRSDGRNLTRLPSDGASSDAPPLPERKKPRAQKQETAPERKLCISPKIEIHSPVREKEISPRRPHERKMSVGRDIRQAEQRATESHSEHRTPLYSEVLSRRNLQSRDTGRRVSDIDNPEVIEVNTQSKFKRSSMVIRSDSDKQNIDVPPKVQRLSAKSPVRGPERQVRLQVFETAPGFLGKLEDSLRSGAAGFSNQTYVAMSELDRKSSETSLGRLARPSRSEESEWSDTETENSSVFEEQCTDTETGEESASPAQTKSASTSRSEYMYVTNIGPPQKTYVRRESSIENRQSTSSTLSPVQSEQFSPSGSDEHVMKESLLAAESHSKSRSEYMYVTSIGPAQKSYVRRGSNIENRQSATSTLRPVQSQQFDTSAPDKHVIQKETSLLSAKDHIAKENAERRASSEETCSPSETALSRNTSVGIETPDEIHYKRLMSIAERNRPQLPTRIPRSNPSESEYSDDTETDSSATEPRENVETVAKGYMRTEESRAPTRSECINVTEIEPTPMSCVRSGPSSTPEPREILETQAKGHLQSEENRARTRSEYMNVAEIGPTRMSCVRSDPSSVPEPRDIVETQAKGHLQSEENRVRTRSEYMNVAEIVPTRMSCVRSGLSSVQDTNPVEDDSSAVKSEYDNPLYGTIVQSSDEKPSEAEKLPIKHKRKDADVQRPQGSIFYIVGTRKPIPERAGVSQRQRSAMGDDALRSDEQSMEGNIDISRKHDTGKQGVRGPDNSPSQSAVDTTVRTDVAPLKQENQTPSFRQQLPDPNSRSNSHNSHSASRRETELNINKSRILSSTVSESESGSVDQQLQKYSGAKPGRKSSEGLDSRSAAELNPLPSPVEMKAPIQVQGVKPTRQAFAIQSVPPSQSLSSAPLERVVLPVIGSRVLSPRLQTQSTHRGSSSTVLLRPVSPLGSHPLRSPGLVSRTLSLSKSETNLSREFSVPSSKRNPTPPLPASTRRLSIPSAQGPPEASGRPVATRHRSKSAVIVLPETPLTLRSDQPSRRNPVHERK